MFSYHGQNFMFCLFCFYITKKHLFLFGCSSSPQHPKPPHSPSGFPLKFRAPFSHFRPLSKSNFKISVQILLPTLITAPIPNTNHRTYIFPSNTQLHQLHKSITHLFLLTFHKYPPTLYKQYLLFNSLIPKP